MTVNNNSTWFLHGPCHVDHWSSQLYIASTVIANDVDSLLLYMIHDTSLLHMSTWSLHDLYSFRPLALYCVNHIRRDRHLRIKHIYYIWLMFEIVLFSTLPTICVSTPVGWISGQRRFWRYWSGTEMMVGAKAGTRMERKDSFHSAMSNPWSVWHYITTRYV